MVGRVNHAGYTISVSMLGGKDLIAGDEQNMSISTGAGDDKVYMYWTGIVVGDAGNDELYSYGNTAQTWILGGDGDDCMDAKSNLATIYDCGSGLDSYELSDAATASGSATCEQPVVSCN